MAHRDQSALPTIPTIRPRICLCRSRSTFPSVGITPYMALRLSKAFNTTPD